METSTSRKQPNILVTGTPGTGKTTLCSIVAENTSITHINVSALIVEKSLHDGKDNEFDTFILNEDKVCDELEEKMGNGNNIVDFHSCDFFPERWFDLVIILRTDNSVLYPRLEKRGYSSEKISENIECEIMQVVFDEACESYKPDIVKEWRSDTLEDMERNVKEIEAWITAWKEGPIST